MTSGRTDDAGDEGELRYLAWLHARTRAGDGDAAGRLLTLLYPRVRAHVRRRLRRHPPDVVADAVQEAMATVTEQLASCRATSGRPLVRWALVVGWHAALRHVRLPVAGAAGCETVVLDVAALDAAAFAAGRLAPHPGTAGGWGDVPDGDEVWAASRITAVLLRLVREACQELGPGGAALVWHRAAGRSSYRTLATAEGTTPAAAKRRYQRAVARLRRIVLARVRRLPEPERSALLRRLRRAVDDVAA